MTREELKHDVICDLIERVSQTVRHGDVRALREVITEALKTKVHHDLAKASEFQSHLLYLAANIEDRGDDYVVLILAELGRLYASIRSKPEWISTLAARILSGRKPASFQYGDGDQRHHAALAVVASGVSLDPYLLAKAVVDEEKGEKARRVWVRALIDGVSLPHAFKCMASAITEADAKSGDHRSLRLQRILEALNEQLAHPDFQIDDSICDGVRDFVTKAFSRVPRPQEYKTSAGAVEEVVKAAVQLIRIRFRLGAEPAFYRAVALAERWLPDGGWILFTGSSVGVIQLRRILLDGLLLLLEQGKPDQRLLEVHRALSPDKNLAQKELRALETSARNLPPELRQWLVSGGTKMLTTRAVEMDETDDLSIAMAMIVADKLRHTKGTAVDALIEDIRFRAPLHVNTITDLVDLSMQLIERVSLLAERRRLRLFGLPGEVVDYSPHAHRLPGDEPPVRRVQIQSPGVEQRGRTASRVVVPALVESTN